MADMELANYCENPYPFVPAAVLDGADAVRASLTHEEVVKSFHLVAKGVLPQLQGLGPAKQRIAAG